MTHRADAAGQSPAPHAPLGRLRGTLSGGDWGRLTLMFVSILAVNALGWLIYLAVVLPQHIDYRGYGGTRGLGIGLGVAVTAWSWASGTRSTPTTSRASTTPPASSWPTANGPWPRAT